MDICWKLECTYLTADRTEETHDSIVRCGNGVRAYVPGEASLAERVEAGQLFRLVIR